jgi:hypothetical protein
MRSSWWIENSILSTDTELLEITDGIFAGFDHHQSTILVTLDQSTAFAFVDYETLTSRLEVTFEVTESVLE